MGFLESKYLYLGLLILSIAYPLAQSFEWRLKLYKNFKAIITGTIVMMLLFIPWDIWFTKIGVWWFKDDYITGFKVFELPIEEWLFFIIVPYACVFIHEVLIFFIKKDLFKSIARPFFLVSGFALIGLALFYSPQYYTAITFGLAGIGVLLLSWFNPVWIGRFLMTYLVSWLPFLLVNGALTGNFTKAPVVNYNPAEIIGFRVTTIPVEDSVYNLLMLLIVIAVFEHLKQPIKEKKEAFA